MGCKNPAANDESTTEGGILRQPRTLQQSRQHYRGEPQRTEDSAPCQLGLQLGQASLDYLLILAAFVGVAAITVPAVQNLSSAVLFASEARNAASFADVLSARISSAAEMGNGTCIEACAQANNEWVVGKDGNKLYLAIEKDGREKKFERRISGNFSAGKIILNSSFCISIVKKEGIVSIADGEC